MSRTFNFKQSQTLLKVDPKTFGRWLEKAKIDPNKQINLADPREKLLTEEQILMLARVHGREIHFPPLDQEAEQESPVAVIITTVDERLTSLEQLITQHFDQVEERFERVEAQLRVVIADLQHDLVKPEPTVSLAREQVKAVRPTAPKTTPVRTAVRKSAKKTTRGKRLPKTLIPLSAFKIEHHVSNKAVEYALEKHKITVERGKWVHNNRNVMIALSQQGQHEFYSLFHGRDGFQPCNACPHTL
jgi:hypothetical protein